MISQQQVVTALQHQRLVVVSVFTLSRCVVEFLIFNQSFNGNEWFHGIPSLRGLTMTSKAASVVLLVSLCTPVFRSS